MEFHENTGSLATAHFLLARLLAHAPLTLGHTQTIESHRNKIMLRLMSWLPISPLWRASLTLHLLVSYPTSSPSRRDAERVPASHGAAPTVPLLGSRYQYVKKIGRGSFAVIIRAEDTFDPDRRHVAIKVMHAQYLEVSMPYRVPLRLCECTIRSHSPTVTLRSESRKDATSVQSTGQTRTMSLILCGA